MAEDTRADAHKPAVAHGTRRDEVRYEADPDQGVKVSHTFRPEGPLPSDEQTGSDRRDGVEAPPQDLKVTKPAPSIWEARAETGDKGA